MEITSETIKKLRERTGAGMMDCKRALEASGGDMEKAIEYLRKKGAAVGQKRADRAAKEGAIATRVSPDGKRGVIVEVNSETDFVGRSEDFVNFGHLVAEAIEKNTPGPLDQIQSLAVRGKTVAEHLNDLLAKVGEKIEIRRYAVLEAPDGRISSYTHLGNKIGVLVDIAGTALAGSSETVGRDIAMQVAAMNPMVVSRDRIEPSVVEAELEVYRSQAKNEGKPDKIVDRIAQGKLDKFYQEVVLMEQTFIKDGGKTVKDYLQEAAGPGGETLVVRNFTRYHLGEEIR